MKAFILFVLAIAGSCSDGQASNQSSPVTTASQGAKSAPKVPLQGRVTDAADILNASEEASLTTRLQEFEQSSGRQIVVVTVPSLGGQDIAVFTTELGNAWGIGGAEQDDGIILLVAPNERQARIAVGLGLERTLPDALSQKIMDSEIIPHFREGDLVGGINAGVMALIQHGS